MIGRSNKQLRKIGRMLYVLKRLDWIAYQDAFIKAWNEAISNVIKFMLKFYDEVQRRNNVSHTSQ